MLDCSKQLSDVLNKVRNKWKIFLAYELDSAFGSNGYYNSSSDERFIPIRNQIFTDVFNGSLQMKLREERLIKAAGGITDKGFIALLEKTIATHADCIILLGTTSSLLTHQHKHIFHFTIAVLCVLYLSAHMITMTQLVRKSHHIAYQTCLCKV